MSNPTLNDNTFNNTDTVYVNPSEAMSVNGTLTKTLILLAFVVIGGFFSWTAATSGDMSLMTTLTIAGAIIGTILAFVIIFKKTLAPVLSPLYAVCEGLFLGGISAITEAELPGVVMQAVGGTFAAAFTVLALYMGRIITVTNKVRSTIIGATFAVAIFYLIAFVLSFFGIRIPFLYNASLIGIGFNVLVVILASANLLLDFDIIEKGVNAFAPKYMEWYCSFGVMVTLVWLYIEILKLLSRLNKR